MFYIMLNNVNIITAKIITGNFGSSILFFYIKGSLCLAKDPDYTSGSTFAVFIMLKTIPLFLLLSFRHSKKKSILNILLINYYLYDIFSILSFISIPYLNSEVFLYSFSALPLFVTSKIFTDNYIIFPIISSLIGIIFLIISKKSLLVDFWRYTLFYLLGLTGTVIFLIVGGKIFSNYTTYLSLF